VIKTELDPFLTEISNFPIIFNVICDAIDFINGAVEEEKIVTRAGLPN